jgi:hypothetical protein
LLTELPASLVTPEAEPPPLSAASTHRTPAPVLVTVHHVVFSAVVFRAVVFGAVVFSAVVFSATAAAPVAPTLRRRPDTTPMAQVRGVLTTLMQPRPHRPHRDPTYFQTARMSREMDRL